MDYITVIRDERKVAQLILERLAVLGEWCQMAFKARKNRSLSMKGGYVIKVLHRRRKDSNSEEARCKCFNRWYNLPVTDHHRGVEIQRQTEAELRSIDKCSLPGKFNVCFMDFGLAPRIMWLLMRYEVSLSQVEIIES